MPASRTSTRAAIRRLAATIYAVALIVAASAVLVGQRGTGAPPPPRPKPLIASAVPTRSCESLRELTLTDTTIEAASADAGTAQVPASCRVTAIVAHPSTRDRIRIWIALPMTDWNGRFQGVGGGGFSGGNPNAVAQPLRAGYAAGSTDTGHEGGSGSFALDANGRLDWEAIRDNAYAGIHEMTVVGKALTAAFYGTPPRRAYFNGCSTGGRQGLSEAQRYPADYDGVLAGAPAVNWTKLHVAQMWGSLMMLETNTVVPSCKFAAATAAAVAACDGLDGVKDGVLENPRACTFDPKVLVGTTPGDCGAITEADAKVIRAIWEGPRRRDGSFLWHGLERGADFSGLSGTAGTPLAPRPNGITLEWWRYFLTQDPQWNWTSLTRASYERYWDQSVEQFGAVFATDNPDLTAFKARGGRIIMWHGWSDQLIYPADRSTTSRGCSRQWAARRRRRSSCGSSSPQGSRTAPAGRGRRPADSSKRWCAGSRKAKHRRRSTPSAAIRQAPSCDRDRFASTRRPPTTKDAGVTDAARELRVPVSRSSAVPSELFSVPSFFCAPSFLSEALIDLVPVDDVPPGREVVGPAILVVQVVGVLPDVDTEDGLLAFHHRIVLVRCALDRELAC